MVLPDTDGAELLAVSKPELVVVETKETAVCCQRTGFGNAHAYGNECAGWWRVFSRESVAPALDRAVGRQSAGAVVSGVY